MLSDESYDRLTLKYTNNENRVKIYSAFDRTRNKEVIIKEIQCDSAADAEFYMLEGQNIISERHPHICECYDVSTESKQEGHFTYIVTEKLDHDLNDEIVSQAKEGVPIMEERLLAMTIGLVDALAYLQMKNLAHRDIKPHNIFISQTGTAKLGDFGSSRECMAGYGQFSMQGTPVYLSPKVRQAYARFFVDPSTKVEHNVYKSDVFSLGLTLVHAMKLALPQALISLDQLEGRIEKTLSDIQGYPQLLDLVRLMLTVDEDRRPDFLELNHRLQPVQVQVADVEVEEVEVQQSSSVSCCYCNNTFEASIPGAKWMDCSSFLHGFCSSTCEDSFISRNAKGNFFLCPLCGSRNTISFRSKQSLEFEQAGQIEGMCSSCQREEQVFQICHPLCFECASSLANEGVRQKHMRIECGKCRKPLPTELLKIVLSPEDLAPYKR